MFSHRTIRKGSLILICLLALILCSCGPGTTVAPTEAPEVEPTEAPEVEPTEAPEVEPTEAPEMEVGYKPEIRPAKESWKIGYGVEDFTVDFDIIVTENIEEVAEEMGVELLICDNKTLSGTEESFNCAELFVNQDVDGVITFNCIADIAPALMDIWNEAGLPVVAIECAHPGAHRFGADNQQAGIVAGEFLAKWAKEQWAGTPPEEIYITTFENPMVPEVALDRVRYAVKTIKEQIPGIPEENITVLNSDGTTDTVQANMEAWLVANPEANHILITMLHGGEALGASNACVISGRRDECVIVGHGAMAVSLTELAGDPEATSIRGDVDFFPDHYGEYVVPIIVDLIEGVSVPEVVGMEHLVLTRETVCDYHPEYCE